MPSSTIESVPTRNNAASQAAASYKARARSVRSRDAAGWTVVPANAGTQYRWRKSPSRPDHVGNGRPGRKADHIFLNASTTAWPSVPAFFSHSCSMTSPTFFRSAVSCGLGLTMFMPFCLS